MFQASLTWSSLPARLKKIAEFTKSIGTPIFQDYPVEI